MNKVLTTYLSVFEGRLTKIKEDIKKEISKPKKERSKHFLKDLVVESKKLKRLVRDMKQESQKLCPHCGEII
jgi:hypothetical protein